jgi:hypothetical protein
MMRRRAELNRMFVYWKLTDVALLLTFRKGFAFENLKLVLHSKEYRTLAGSWSELVAMLKNDVLRDVLGQTGGFIKHALTPKSNVEDNFDDLTVLPKSKLQLRLDSLGRAVSFGKGRQRMLEEEKLRVQQQLTQQQGQVSQTILEQVTLPDEILIGNAQKREVDNQLVELKSELLMGNMQKRSAEKDKMLKKKKREEREMQRLNGDRRAALLARKESRSESDVDDMNGNSPAMTHGTARPPPPVKRK